MSSTGRVENLFSYGTLQDDEVQLSTFGRLLAGKPDALEAYSQSTCGPYLNIQFTGQRTDHVGGTRFEVTKAELEEADAYETTPHYTRIEVQLASGARAWVYLNQNCE